MKTKKSETNNINYQTLMGKMNSTSLAFFVEQTRMVKKMMNTIQYAERQIKDLLPRGYGEVSRYYGIVRLHSCVFVTGVLILSKRRKAYKESFFVTHEMRCVDIPAAMLAFCEDEQENRAHSHLEINDCGDHGGLVRDLIEGGVARVTNCDPNSVHVL